MLTAVSKEPFSWQIGSGDWFIPSLPRCFRTQILFADWNLECLWSDYSVRTHHNLKDLSGLWTLTFISGFWEACYRVSLGSLKTPDILHTLLNKLVSMLSFQMANCHFHCFFLMETVNKHHHHFIIFSGALRFPEKQTWLSKDRAVSVGRGAEAAAKDSPSFTNPPWAQYSMQIFCLQLRICPCWVSSPWHTPAGVE